MAVEKLSDGIRKFAADAIKLETMIKVGNTSNFYYCNRNQKKHKRITYFNLSSQEKMLNVKNGQ